MHYGIGGIGMLIVWAAVIAVIIYLIRLLINTDRGGASRDKSPMDILESKYAGGEISRDEFISKKKDLAERRP